MASGLRERVTVSRRWLSARLEMGRYTNASRSPRRMNPGSLRPFQQARAKLQLLDKNKVTESMSTNFLRPLGLFIAGSPKRGNTVACAREFTPPFCKGGHK